MPKRRWLALARAIPVVALVRVGLWLVPYVFWRPVLAHALRVPRRAPRSDRPRWSIEEIMWSVSRAARLVPAASCLTQSLAAQQLLARAGHASRLRLGVAPRDGARSVHAHAWLEVEPTMLGVATSTDAFTPLMLADELDLATTAASVPPSRAAGDPLSSRG